LTIQKLPYPTPKTGWWLPILINSSQRGTLPVNDESRPVAEKNIDVIVCPITINKKPKRKLEAWSGPSFENAPDREDADERTEQAETVFIYSHSRPHLPSLTRISDVNILVISNLRVKRIIIRHNGRPN
jgi:hypothetical protein